MKKNMKIVSYFLFMMLIFAGIGWAEEKHIMVKPEVFKGRDIEHIKEAVKNLEDTIKVHLDGAIKAGDAAHAKEAIEHAKEAVKHAEEAIKHAEEAKKK
ncbi:MAG: hypothetical protein HY097_00935 [Nitrospinae bacterium]|nr:hypothetical protein [Nitrospinota bacterium]MBI3814731.1 hypothetical protein [Nitrospinota bacterium]